MSSIIIILHHFPFKVRLISSEINKLSFLALNPQVKCQGLNLEIGLSSIYNMEDLFKITAYRNLFFPFVKSECKQLSLLPITSLLMLRLGFSCFRSPNYMLLNKSSPVRWQNVIVKSAIILRIQFVWLDKVVKAFLMRNATGGSVFLNNMLAHKYYLLIFLISLANFKIFSNIIFPRLTKRVFLHIYECIFIDICLRISGIQIQMNPIAFFFFL